MSDDGRLAERTVREAYGASQVGPFDYCPKLGFREYWYPGIQARQVRGTPVNPDGSPITPLAGGDH